MLLLLSVLPAGLWPATAAYEAMLKTLLDHSVPEVKVKTLQSWLAAGEKVILLDSRKAEEFAVSHLKGAARVGYDDFPAGHDLVFAPGSRVVIYCSVGYRSEKIAERLRRSGMNDIYNLYGGIFEWYNEGLPVYRGSQQVNEVHPYSKSWGVWLKKRPY